MVFNTVPNGFTTPTIALTIGQDQSSTFAGAILANSTLAVTSTSHFSAAVTFGTNTSITGTLLLANGAGSGATITVQNNSATSAYNFNLPATSGTSGQILASGGGSSSAMTWLSTTGTGNVVLAASPTLTGTVTIPNPPVNPTDAAPKAYVDAVTPSQTGNSGKFLTTNGTVTSWGSIPSIATSCSVYQTSGTVLTINTWISIGFDTEAYKDVSTWHSTSVNNSRITVDFTGRLRLTGTVDFGASGNAIYAIRLLRNGTVIKNGINANQTGGLTNIVLQIDDETACSSTDYFELQAYTNNSGPTTGIGIAATSLKATRIS